MTDWHDLCDHCGINPRRTTSRGTGRECETCSRYRRRTGANRPDHLIRRAWEREQTRA